MGSGWHHANRGERHPVRNLSLTWTHDSGAKIYQGRPYADDPSRFVYMLVRADGVSLETSLLKKAKDAVNG